MRASLRELLPDAAAGGYAVPCFNVFGLDEARAVVDAAESLAAPVILATNREMVDFAGTAPLAGMLGRLADDAAVPVCVHLDHCDDPARIRAAVEDGYTSVMYDGSQDPVDENVERCREVVAHARRHGVSVEGEIGSVPYSEGRAHVRDELTEPAEAERFARESGVDAVAVAVGNVHRLRTAGSTIDFARLDAIRARVAQPLVIHGASGIAADDQRRLVARGVAKFNIGTSLRQTFGAALRGSLAADPDGFDRLTLFAPVIDAMRACAAGHLERLGAAGRADGAASAEAVANAAASGGRGSTTEAASAPGAAPRRDADAAPSVPTGRAAPPAADEISGGADARRAARRPAEPVAADPSPTVPSGERPR